jgi:carboxypeptidase C (cathepsin A)
MNDDGSTPPPPARITDNPDCALDAADLVFIDAIGTGYSRAANEDAKRRFFDREGDLESYVAFILQYMQRNARFGSPIYFFGESYGGMRVAALADLLVRRGVPSSGVVILSSALDFHLLSGGLTNPLPYVLALPSFATIAAHHGRLDASLGRDGDSLRGEVERWAETVYLPALLKGRRVSATERARIVAGLIRYTGLPEPVIRAENLRIEVPTFMKYLLTDRGLVVGRTDGRIAGAPVHDRVEEPYYDPAMGAMTPAFSSATQQLFTGALRVPLDIPYRMYSRDVASRFLLGPAPIYGRDGYPQSLTALQAAAVKNPAFRILSLQGLYDLAAPYWSTEFGLDQLLVSESFDAQVTQVRLTGGHMSYAEAGARKRIGELLTNFVRQSS